MSYTYVETSTTGVPLYQRSDLECRPDEISVFLPATLFPANRTMTWREDSCRIKNNGSHYVGTISLSECGSTVELENDTVIFSNEIVVLKADDSAFDANSDVTHGEDYESVIPVKCVYPRLSSVSTSYVPVKQNVRFVEKRFGEFDVSIDQFDDDSFRSAVHQGDYSRKVALNDDIFIRIGMNFDRNDIRVKSDQCIATSQPSPADKKWLPLMQSGCPKNGARLLSSANSSDVRFTFKAFDFRHDSTGFIYLHCEVSVCETEDESCSMGCTARMKRSVNVNRKSHLVSAGPFFLQANQAKTDAAPVMLPTVFAAVCFVVAMATTILAAIGWKRRSNK